MQLKQALTEAVQSLEASDVGSPRLNAETLLMFVLGCNRAYLYAHPERELTEEEEARYDEVLAQRGRGVPSQYITGHQEFWGLDLLVSPAVLIPRPETEHLVETVLELARPLLQPRIVDVGTGSGCVALALAHELKDADVCGVDLSAEALEIARANAARLQLDERVRFVQGNVLEVREEAGSSTALRSGRNDVAGGSEGSFDYSARKQRTCGQDDVSERDEKTLSHERTFHDLDFVVSNPPYVGLHEADKVQRSVKEFEPGMAVFAGEHGLDVIRPLIRQAHQALKPGGWLAMEIGYSMRDAVLALLNPTMWDDVRVVPDLQGIPRVIAAHKDPAQSERTKMA